MRLQEYLHSYDFCSTLNLRDVLCNLNKSNILQCLHSEGEDSVATVCGFCDEVHNETHHICLNSWLQKLLLQNEDTVGTND